MPDISVTLSRDFANTFRRYIRDAQGNPTEAMIFNTGEIVRIPANLVEVIADDIGKSLVICTEQKGVLRADREATEKFVQSLSAPPAAPKPKAKPKAKAKAAPKPKDPEPVDEPERADGETDE